MSASVRKKYPYKRLGVIPRQGKLTIDRRRNRNRSRCPSVNMREGEGEALESIGPKIKQVVK